MFFLSGLFAVAGSISGAGEILLAIGSAELNRQKKGAGFIPAPFCLCCCYLVVNSPTY